MINKKRHSNGTLITLIKYGDYQDSRHTKQHTCDTPTDISRTSRGHKQDIKEDIKEDIKKKEAPPPDDDDIVTDFKKFCEEDDDDDW